MICKILNYFNVKLAWRNFKYPFWTVKSFNTRNSSGINKRGNVIKRVKLVNIIKCCLSIKYCFWYWSHTNFLTRQAKRQREFKTWINFWHSFIKVGQWSWNDLSCEIGCSYYAWVSILILYIICLQPRVKRIHTQDTKHNWP